MSIAGSEGHEKKRYAMREGMSDLESVWKSTDSILGDHIRSGDALLQPISLRNPYIFYLGHLPAFTWNQLLLCGAVTQAINARFETMFSRGIDPDVDDPTQCHAHPEAPPEWPPWTEVVKYRNKVRDGVRSVLAKIPGKILRLIAEHDAMHNETLCYMLAQHASSRALQATPHAAPDAAYNGQQQQQQQQEHGGWVRVQGGQVVLGASQGEHSA
eukprot:IDg8482t1